MNFSGKKSNVNRHSRLLECLREIEKLDMKLEAKKSERKKVTMSRVLVEQELIKHLSCNFLNSNIPKRAQSNFKTFLNLINKTEIKQSVQKQPPVKMNRKLEKTRTNKPLNEAFFIKRNIQLAKYGGGPFAITKEEKKRIDDLLYDLNVTPSKNIKKNFQHNKNNICPSQLEENKNKAKDEFFEYANLQKLMLEEINQKLEAFVVKEAMTYDKVDHATYSKNDESNKSKAGPKRRIKEIDKKLEALNSTFLKL